MAQNSQANFPLIGSFCGGCGHGIVRGECAGALANLGILKVHWECWSQCNLSCDFCYRTITAPLATEKAIELLQAIKTGGVQRIVFAGGDPSLRPDVPQLVEIAIALGLQTEIQTNAHYLSDSFKAILKRVDLVGLSLDGPDMETHDLVRSKPGNFERVMQLLEYLWKNDTPTILRTILSKRNVEQISEIAHIVNSYSNIRRWSLAEFSALGAGIESQKLHEISREEIQFAVKDSASKLHDPSRLEVYYSEAKVNTYMLVRSDGGVYGVGNVDVLAEPWFPVVGWIQSSHLSELAERLPFSKASHHARYAQLGASFNKH